MPFDQIRDWGWTQFIHPDDVEENIRVWRHSIETGEAFEITHRFRRADGAYRWHLSRAHAMRDAAGNISKWIGSNTEIHEQKELAETLRQREDTLREREAYLRLVLDSAADGFYGVDRDGVTTTCNAAFLHMLGFERAEDAVGKKLHDVIHHSHPDGSHYPKEECPIYRTARTGRAAHVDNELFFRLDGSSFPVEYWSYPILRDDEVDGAVTTFIDITERRQAQEQQRLLLREMNHRVKNLFALAGSVVTLSARSAGTPKELAEAVRERLAALARAHELTLPDIAEGGEKPDWATALPAMVRTIISPYVSEYDARVTINGPDVPISRNAVTSVALLLHEFATNAAKYGALSSESGHLEISWSVEKGELLLAWREHGGPALNGPPENEGFGSLLAKLTVTGQLAGKISRDWNAEGLTVNLSAPLERLTM